MHQEELENKFIQMVRQHERIIYKVCSFYISNEHPLADLYQEVVCNLWNGFPKFKNGSSYSTWTYKVALNTCISGLRKEIKRPKNVIPVASLTESLIEPENMNEEIREMYRQINRLKALEKALILLYLEEKSYREIADITGLTVTHVGVKLNRIKEKLKQMLDQ